MELAAYFDRIGYSGARAADLATLNAVMHAHVAAIPFENLDVQLGRPLSLDRDAIFAKLVGARRGGWCYEQNGLLAWALGEMGFDVRRLNCGVMRVERGDAAMGNHLALAVVLDRTWLVDAGFGGSLARPIPLAQGTHDHAPFGISLTLLDDGHWRFSEYFQPDKPFSFDFTEGPADEALFARQCAEMQVDAKSPFVENLVAQRRCGDHHLSLRGRVFVERGPDGESRKLIADADELVTTLNARFGIDLPPAATLWDRIEARHAALFADQISALGA